jgi:hypothetical protein
MKVLPPPSSAGKLFIVGATVGPVVDSLHNQCLLEYDKLPIALNWPSPAVSQSLDYFFCSSWTVPPLLGVAYVVLGGILPRLFETLISSTGKQRSRTNDADEDRQPMTMLGPRAIAAIGTTALIIKLSEFLETHPGLLEGLLPFSASSDANIFVMLLAALTQWALLDGTLTALLAAGITSIGGPLSELPFVANGFWHYLPQAGDYLPLENVASNNLLLSSLLGDDYQRLALSSITGPCYFAVTMDAIALGRWFDSQTDSRDDNAF